MALHSIECPFLTTRWEDKIYANLYGDDNSSLGLHSSNVFNTTIDLNDGVLVTAKLIPEPFESNFEIKLKRAITLMEDKIEWNTHCDSIFLPTDFDLRVKHHSTSSEVMNSVFYTIPVICHNCNNNQTYSGELHSVFHQHFLDEVHT
jgi:hypothetical protein